MNRSSWVPRVSEVWEDGSGDVDSFDEDEIEFDFFAEPETVEAVERRVWLSRLPRSHVRGSRARRAVKTSRLVGIARLAGAIVGLIVVFVVMALWVGGCQGQRGDYARYLLQVRSLAQSSDGDGRAVAATLSALTVTRSGLAEQLQAEAVLEQQSYDRAQLLLPPAPLQQVHQELVAALALRAKGLTGLAEAIMATTGKGVPGADPVDALVGQARLLTTSDVVWEQLYRIPTEQLLQARNLAGLVVPTSRFVTTSQIVSASTFIRLVTRLTGKASTGGNVPLVLKLGATGASVKQWQKELNRWLRTQPGATALPLDGHYGPETVAATKALQQAAGITADGTVGPVTRLALKRLAGSG